MIQWAFVGVCATFSVHLRSQLMNGDPGLMEVL